MTLRRVDRGKQHWYELTADFATPIDDGRHVESVSKILSEGVPKPWMGRWAAREVATYAADNLREEVRRGDRAATIDLFKEAPWRKRDAAANRGTEVHHLAQRLAAGEDVEVPEELAGHVDSYLRWWEEWQPTDELVERPAVNRQWQYAGTFDLWAALGGFGTLVDLKTNMQGPYPEVALQLAAYAQCETYLDLEQREQPMPPVQRFRVLWLRSDGYDYLPVDVTAREWKTFLWVQSVGRWMRERADRYSPERVLGSAILPASEVAQ